LKGSKPAGDVGEENFKSNPTRKKFGLGVEVNGLEQAGQNLGDDVENLFAREQSIGNFLSAWYRLEDTRSWIEICTAVAS